MKSAIAFLGVAGSEKCDRLCEFARNRKAIAYPNDTNLKKERDIWVGARHK